MEPGWRACGGSADRLRLPRRAAWRRCAPQHVRSRETPAAACQDRAAEAPSRASGPRKRATAAARRQGVPQPATFPRFRSEEIVEACRWPHLRPLSYLPSSFFFLLAGAGSMYGVGIRDNSFFLLRYNCFGSGACGFRGLLGFREPACASSAELSGAPRPNLHNFECGKVVCLGAVTTADPRGYMASFRYKSGFRERRPILGGK